MHQQNAAQPNEGSTPNVEFCREKVRLGDEFLRAIHYLGVLQSQQAQAVIEGDPDFSRFDLLIHMANERKDQTKYALLIHVENHHC
jgi:hypothetical protein